MKVTINLDVTPQEARSFFGLPDVEPLNKLLIEAMMNKAKEDLPKLADPEKYIKEWMASGVTSGLSMGGKGVEQMQNFMNAMMKTAMGAGGSGAKSGDGESAKE